MLCTIQTCSRMENCRHHKKKKIKSHNKLHLHPAVKYFARSTWPAYQNRGMQIVKKNRMQTVLQREDKYFVLSCQYVFLSVSFPHSDSTVIQRMHWLNHGLLYSTKYVSVLSDDNLQNCSSKFPACKQIITTSWDFLFCDLFAPHHSYITCSLLQPASSSE